MAFPTPPRSTRTDGVQVLHPGDVALAERGERLETLLGSCVSIVLTDPRRTLGAMCHIVHCKPATAGAIVSAAYADVALDRMYALLRSRGIEPTLCEAYVYGGGNMFPELFPQGHVGENNAQWALDALAHDGVPVLYHDVGGNTYRRLSWVVGPDMPQVTAVAI
jgi:chemotaxis protein CheD